MTHTGTLLEDNDFHIFQSDVFLVYSVQSDVFLVEIFQEVTFFS